MIIIICTCIPLCFVIAIIILNALNFIMCLDKIINRIVTILKYTIVSNAFSYFNLQKLKFKKSESHNKV